MTDLSPAGLTESSSSLPQTEAETGSRNAPARLGELRQADRAHRFCERPCDNSTSTWRSFVTISSGLCFFCGIQCPPMVRKPTSGRTSFQGAVQCWEPLLTTRVTSVEQPLRKYALAIVQTPSGM